MIVVNPENCTADQQLRLLLHTASTGVRKKFTVISKEPLLASVSILDIKLACYPQPLGTR